MQVTFEFFDGDIIYKFPHWVTHAINVFNDAAAIRAVINDLIWSLVCFIIVFCDEILPLEQAGQITITQQSFVLAIQTIVSKQN